MNKADAYTNNCLTAVSDGAFPAYDTVSVPSAPSVRKLVRDTPLIIFVLLCSVFQMSCIQVDGNFNTGVAAMTSQVEDSVSSGMLLTSAYTDYFQEFNRWPDSHAKLVEYYKTKAKTDASLIAVYKQLEEFTEVKVVSIEDRIIELEFKRPPISPVNDNRSVATGKLVCAIGASSCSMLPQNAAENHEAVPLSNNSVWGHKIESQEVAKLLVAFSETTQPLIDFHNVSRCTVIEFMEYMLSAGFEIDSIQHPIMSYPESLHENKLTLREEKTSYLLAFCKLAHLIGLNFGIHKDGKLIVLSENDDTKDVYFVSIVKDDSEARIIGIKYNRKSFLLKEERSTPAALTN